MSDTTLLVIADFVSNTDLVLKTAVFFTSAGLVIHFVRRYFKRYVQILLDME